MRNRSVKFILIAAMLILSTVFGVRSCETVDPDKEGILVSNFGQDYTPETPSDDDYEIVRGRVFTAFPSTSLYQVPMTEHRGRPSVFEVYTSDAGRFKVDPEFSFRAIRGNGVEIIFRFRSFYSKGNNGDFNTSPDVSESFLNNISDKVLDTRVRNRYKQIAGLYTSDSLLYNRVSFEKQVNDSLVVDFNKAHFKLEALSSGLIPPKAMQDMIDKRNRAAQEALQVTKELNTALAKQKIRISDAEAEVKVAKLKAEANRFKNLGLSDKLLIEQFIKKWDGKLPTVSSGDDQMTLMLNNLKK